MWFLSHLTMFELKLLSASVTHLNRYSQICLIIDRNIKKRIVNNWTQLINMTHKFLIFQLTHEMVFVCFHICEYVP